MSKHTRHRWRRFVRDGYVVRIECRVCHKTPYELLSQQTVKSKIVVSKVLGAPADKAVR